LFSVIAVCAGGLVPSPLVGQSSTWPSTALSVSMLLVAWALGRWQVLLVTVVVVGAYVGGLAVAGQPVLPTAAYNGLVLPVQALIGLFVVRRMKRTASAADTALRQLEHTQRATAVTHARLRDADEQRIELHDTVLATLTAVARGGLATRSDLLRRRA